MWKKSGKLEKKWKIIRKFRKHLEIWKNLDIRNTFEIWEKNWKFGRNLKIG